MKYIRKEGLFQNRLVKDFLKMEVDNDCAGMLDVHDIDAIKRYGKFLDANLTFDSGEWKTIPEALGDYREAHGKERS